MFFSVLLAHLCPYSSATEIDVSSQVALTFLFCYYPYHRDAVYLSHRELRRKKGLFTERQTQISIQGTPLSPAADRGAFARGPTPRVGLG